MESLNIFEECKPILENASRHRITGQRCFMTAYQIWFLLKKRNPFFCDRLCSSCGDSVGAGSVESGGVADGPAKRIAIALGNSNLIETMYFDTKKTFFGNDVSTVITASGQSCGIFRLK